MRRSVTAKLNVQDNGISCWEIKESNKTVRREQEIICFK